LFLFSLFNLLFPTEDLFPVFIFKKSLLGAENPPIYQCLEGDFGSATIPPLPFFPFVISSSNNSSKVFGFVTIGISSILRGFSPADPGYIPELESKCFDFSSPLSLLLILLFLV